MRYVLPHGQFKWLLAQNVLIEIDVTGVEPRTLQSIRYQATTCPHHELPFL